MIYLSLEYESLEWCVEKFLLKHKAAFPEQQPPSKEEVEKYIKSCWSQNRHIIYPLAGEAWNQVEWQKACKLNK